MSKLVSEIYYHDSVTLAFESAAGRRYTWHIMPITAHGMSTMNTHTKEEFKTETITAAVVKVMEIEAKNDAQN